MKIFFALLIIIVFLSSCSHQQINENMVAKPLESYEKGKLYAVEVKFVMIDQSDEANKVPVIILSNKQNDNQFIPIWVGISEGLSINMALRKQKLPRPGTHDLFSKIMGQFKMHLTKVVITEVINETYFAVMTMESHGETKDIDARPSDAIAIALRNDSPIFVSEKIINKHGWAELQEKDIENVKPKVKDDESI